MSRRVPAPYLHEPLDPASAGARAAKSIHRHTDQTHAAILALVDELLAISDGGERGPAVRSMPPRLPHVTVR